LESERDTISQLGKEWRKESGDVEKRAFDDDSGNEDF